MESRSNPDAGTITSETTFRKSHTYMTWIVLLTKNQQANILNLMFLILASEIDLILPANILTKQK